MHIQIAFTFNNSSQQLGLIVGLNICPTQCITFNVIGKLLVESPNEKWNGHPVCPADADLPSPANPCAANINDNIASSISATIAASFMAPACATRALGQKPIITSGYPVPTQKANFAVRPKHELDWGSRGVMVKPLLLGLLV
jgi:hypothetical protein